MFSDKSDINYVDNLRFFKVREDNKKETHLQMKLRGDELVTLCLKKNGKKVLKVYDIQLNFLKIWDFGLQDNEEIIDYYQSSKNLFVLTANNNIQIFENEEYEFVKKLDGFNSKITAMNIYDNFLMLGFDDGNFQLIQYNTNKVVKEIKFESQINVLFYLNGKLTIGENSGKISILDYRNNLQVEKTINASNGVEKIINYKDNIIVLTKNSSLEIFKEDKIISKYEGLRLNPQLFTIHLQFLIISTHQNSVIFFNTHKNFKISKTFKLYKPVKTYSIGLDMLLIFYENKKFDLVKIVDKHLLDRFFIRFERYNKEKIEIEEKIKLIKNENFKLTEFYNSSNQKYEESKNKYNKNYKIITK